MNKLTLEQIPGNAFLSKDGQQEGPYSVDQINELLSAGQLQCSDYVWVEGWGDWKQLSGLVPSAPPVPAPAPAAPPPPPITTTIPENEKPNIYLTKDGQQLGPFSLTEINSKLALRAIAESDLAWMEGRPEWAPLSSLPGITSQLFRPFVMPPLRVIACMICIFFIPVVTYVCLFPRNDTDQPPPALLPKTVQLGHLTIEVQRIEIRSSIGADGFATRPSPGAVFVLVHYSITNNSDETEVDWSDNNFVLRDSEDRKFTPSSNANTALMAENAGKDFILTELQPGVTKPTVTAFEVPEQSAKSTLTFVIMTGGFFGGKEEVQLQ